MLSYVLRQLHFHINMLGLYIRLPHLHLAHFCHCNPLSHSSYSSHHLRFHSHSGLLLLSHDYSHGSHSLLSYNYSHLVLILHLQLIQLYLSLLLLNCLWHVFPLLRLIFQSIIWAL